MILGYFSTFQQLDSTIFDRIQHQLPVKRRIAHVLHTSTQMRLTPSYEAGKFYCWCAIAWILNLVTHSFQLNNYFKAMKNYPELLTDLRLERVKHVLVSNHFLLSPLRDQHGHRLAIFNSRNSEDFFYKLNNWFRRVLFPQLTGISAFVVWMTCFARQYFAFKDWSPSKKLGLTE